MLQPAARGSAGAAAARPRDPAGAEPRVPLDLEVDVRVSPDPEPKPWRSRSPRRRPRRRSARPAERERRRSRRGSYEKKVPAFGTRALRVLVARDLSQGGMRVERFSGLEVGDRLHLAIYGAADHEPFLVWATVIATTARTAWRWSSTRCSPQLAEQLEKVVADLPAVESLHDDEAHAMGTVVTEILES